MEIKLTKEELKKVLIELLEDQLDKAKYSPSSDGRTMSVEVLDSLIRALNN